MGRLARLGRAVPVAVVVLLLAASPEAVSIYNQACRESRAGDQEAAAKLLIASIKAGFDDVSHMRRDPDLHGLRGHPIFRAIVGAREAADEMLSRRRFEWWRTKLDDRYAFEDDSHLKLHFVSALDAAANADVREMIDEHLGLLQTTLFAGVDRPYLLVVIPADDDGAVLLTRARGLYNHRRQELVVRSPGRELRHELTHAAHHAHMDALGQQHALWIQEGLGTLYEDYVVHDAVVEFTPNDRDEQARRLPLRRWSEIAMANRLEPRDYPQLRSMFRFLVERGELTAWYHAYIENHAADPTGIATLEAVHDASLEVVEARWRRWLREG